jgi:hypothetical protein
MKFFLRPGHDGGPRAWRAERSVYLVAQLDAIDDHCPRAPTAFTKAGKNK